VATTRGVPFTLALVVAAPLCWGRILLNRGFAADNESRQCWDEYVETRNTCRDFIGDELLAEPEEIDADHPGGFPCFDLFFASHRYRPARVSFAPDELPRSIFEGEFAGDLVCSVVVGKADFQIVSLADVESTWGVQEDIDPKHGVSLRWLLR